METNLNKTTAREIIEKLNIWGSWGTSGMLPTYKSSSIFIQEKYEPKKIYMTEAELLKLDKIITNLDFSKKIIIVKKHLDRKKLKDIAEELDTTQYNVISKYYRTIRDIAEALNQIYFIY